MAAILEISLEFRATHRAEEDRRGHGDVVVDASLKDCPTQINAQLSWLPNY